MSVRLVTKNLMMILLLLIRKTMMMMLMMTMMMIYIDFMCEKGANQYVSFDVISS